MRVFGRTTGLHSTYDQTSRTEISLEIVHKTINVETVMDWHTGVALRADTLIYGPPHSQMTWSALNFFIQMNTDFSMPNHRNAAMLGQFSDSQIFSAMFHVLRDMLAMYIHLGVSIANASKIQLDDSPTQVLELRTKIQNGTLEDDNTVDTAETETETKNAKDIIATLKNEFGLVSDLKSKKGKKSKINVSAISAEIPNQGTGVFYRTHVGSSGDLITKILENRSPKLGTFLLQGDSSSENNLGAQLKDLDYTFAGCAAHGRRPFWRHRNDDDGLCDYMLRAFAILARIESDLAGQPNSKILAVRQKYSAKIWQLIFQKANSVLTAKKPTDAKNHHIWPKTSHFGKACNYIVKNFNELTTYLYYPEIEWTNNKMERLLRGEKLLLLSAKFRKTEIGRILLDFNRTLTMTCRANNVSLKQYLEFLYRNKDGLEDHPELYTPFAFAQTFKQNKAKQAA